MARDTSKTVAEASARPLHRVGSAAELGRLLRGRRRHLGHTQAEAAALCGVGIRFLSELERGKPTVEVDRALRVAQRLGLEVWLGAREGNAFRSEGE